MTQRNFTALASIVALTEGVPLNGHPYHKKSDAELKYIIKDASEAAKSMKSVDAKAEAKYLDQVNDASTVLHYRKTNKLSEGKNGSLYLLYVGPKGSGTLHQQWSGDTSAECHQEYKDSWANEYDKDGKKLKYSHRVVKVKDGETPPKTLSESVEELESFIAEDSTNNFAQPLGDDAVDTLSSRMGVDSEKELSVKLPTSVKAEVAKRIAELKKSIEHYDKKGYNDQSQKQKAIECLEKILDNLSTEDLDGLKKAQIYFGTLMSPITDLFPSGIINFLAKSHLPLVKESEERAEVLKRHIAHHEQQMKTLDKDSTSYSDHVKAIERYKKELQ